MKITRSIRQDNTLEDSVVLSERGIHGFVAWMASIASYIVFLIWAFVPDTYLNSVGITYYPSKHCAVAIPSFLLVTAAVVVAGYIGLNLVRTPDPEDVVTLRTPGAKVAASYLVKVGKKEGIPSISELDHKQRSFFLATNGGRRRQSYD